MGVLSRGVTPPITPSLSRYSLSRLVEEPPGRALAAQEDVFLQRQLVEHPPSHAERRVAWEGEGGEMEEAKPPPSTPTTPPLSAIPHTPENQPGRWSNVAAKKTRGEAQIAPKTQRGRPRYAALCPLAETPSSTHPTLRDGGFGDRGSRESPPPRSQPTHPWRGGHGGAGAGARLARRSSSRPPACCNDPGSHLQTASAGRSPSAARDGEEPVAARGRGCHRRHRPVENHPLSRESRGAARRAPTHQQTPEVQQMFLPEDDQGGHAAEGVAAVGFHPRHPADAALPVLAPGGAAVVRRAPRRSRLSP